MGNTMSGAHHSVGMCSIEPYTAPVVPEPVSQCSIVQRASTPDGSTCGYIGYLSRPDIVADWPVPNEDNNAQMTCTRACWDLETCASFSYDQETRQCLLYGERIEAQKPRKSRQGARFFEPSCFYKTCEISETVVRAETRSELDSPLADLMLRHCGLEEVSLLTSPDMDYSEHAFFPVTLPFPVVLYGSTSDSLYMSINGHLSFSAPFITPAEPTFLPHFTSVRPAPGGVPAMPNVDGGMPENSLVAFWTPQQIVNSHHPFALAQSNTPHRLLFSQQDSAYGPRHHRAIKRDSGNAAELEMEDGLMAQGMRYTITGEEGHRKVTFTWKTSKKGDAADIYDYDVVYREDLPGVWMMRYRSVGGVGRTATVGLQGTEASAKFLQYTSHDAPISNSMTLILNSATNTFKRVRRTITSKNTLPEQHL